MRAWVRSGMVAGVVCLATACGADTEDVESVSEPIIYGADNRVDYLSATAEQRKWADSVGVLIPRSVSCIGAPATCIIPLGLPSKQDPATGAWVTGLCSGQPFGPSLLQPLGQATTSIGTCTAFLVGKRRMVAAGHCFIGENGTLAQAQTACQSLAVMFDFKADSYGNAPSAMPQDQSFYTCSSVVGVKKTGNTDWVVFDLDRDTTGRSPLPIRRTGKVASTEDVVLVGHPLALPLKVASGARVIDDSPSSWFWANVDAFTANSGSPVINRDTGVVEGIEVANFVDPDFDFVYNDPLAPLGCLKSHTCSDTGCSGRVEAVARTKLVAASVPSIAPRVFGSGGTATQGGTYKPIAGDFDGDGNADIFWYAPGATADYVWWFSGRKAYTQVPDSSSGTYEVAAGDFNADGRADIVWYAAGAAQDWVSFGKSDKTFEGVRVTLPESTKLFTGDFNGDGKADIFFYNPGAGADSIWWGSAAKTFTSTSYTVSGTYVPLAGDFDGDGVSDIIWYRAGTASDPIWWGSTSKTFSGTPAIAQDGTFQPFVGDFDGDGKSDVFWYAPGATQDRIWWGNGTRGFTDTTTAVSGTYIPIAGDFDGNTASDIQWYGTGTGAESFWWGRVN